MPATKSGWVTSIVVALLWTTLPAKALDPRYPDWPCQQLVVVAAINSTTASRQGDDLVSTLDGGIAISEDPNLRFNYRPNGSENFRVKGFDTGKNVFKGKGREGGALIGGGLPSG